MTTTTEEKKDEAAAEGKTDSGKTGSALATREERRVQRWDPFQMFDELQNEMMRLFGQAGPLIGPGPLSRPGLRPAMTPAAWLPTVDVFEQDDALVIKAELPGLKKENIEVTVDQGDLVLRGERKVENEVKEDRYYRMERTYGSFYRRIPLPPNVKAEQITASYKDGVLEVRIPKAAQQQPQPRTIALT